ncbi:MAG: orotidine 5'-phosphate decarboxylase [Candidatus Magasanikbacteria bacterium RIFOXYC2_FULL_42_28]|uniref:Orotidine 5'-phosphate decarboxylase n=1 Tax=Candidatus Magasanikbacteria bacterium RIFOXYC2_FULL_42_28 TaxID=1798704 RepID=A0A1F6NU56_9BACT|nr:MAG: orotidine 5'-phosphate decarboxylase [Candidatus Magasanikbacteria bacterium RIFOXYC2_FULL_42_28]
MLSYSQRSTLCTNPTAKQLLYLMDSKQTNLCLAADVTTKAELLQLADQIGPEICVLKTHIDIVDDFDNDLIIQLQRLAEKHNFLIFEDRKFADIGSTVQKQYQNGIYHIADWAHITNAHSVAGPGIITGLKEIGLPKGRGLLLLAEMSPKGALTDASYAQKTVAMAEANTDFVIGFITQRKLSDNPCFINMTPGVKISQGGDDLGQQYNTPEKAISAGADVIIVGRGIIAASDPVAEAKKYRAEGWAQYVAKLSKS